MAGHEQSWHGSIDIVLASKKPVAAAGRRRKKKAVKPRTNCTVLIYYFKGNHYFYIKFRKGNQKNVICQSFDINWKRKKSLWDRYGKTMKILKKYINKNLAHIKNILRI